MYLDYAENQAERHKPMSMEGWVSRLDAFLKFNEFDILENLEKFHMPWPRKLPVKNLKNIEKSRIRTIFLILIRM